jgi:hypothetical protein
MKNIGYKDKIKWITRLPPLGGHVVGVPRALKNGVNKERPLQIGLPPNYPERVYREVSQCVIENAWSFHRIPILVKNKNTARNGYTGLEKNIRRPPRGKW